MLDFSWAFSFDFPASATLLATLGIWGLPGQIALVELYAVGSSALVVVLAVSLANARFFPMAVSFLPLMKPGVRHTGWLFLLVQLLSINSWAAGLRTFPSIQPTQRVYYFVAFGMVIMCAALTGTAIGYYAQSILPTSVALGLVLLNPIYFAMVFALVRERASVFALLIGATIGPVLIYLWPDWGLLFAGIIGGSIAFAFDEMLRRNAKRGKQT